MKSKFWLKEPEKHDFVAAADYLSLHVPEKDAEELAAQLANAKTIQKKAKDILRASQMPLLPKTNIHVQENLKKVRKGNKMSPVLLVRMDGKLIIADGYHRICTIYYLSEDLEIPCRLI